MKVISSTHVGIDQGQVNLFSHFENNGPMWSEEGPRESLKQVVFSKEYLQPPAVHCSVSMWDADTTRNIRVDVTARDITTTGCTISLKSWGDTRLARARVAWISIGEVRSDDDWIID